MHSNRILFQKCLCVVLFRWTLDTVKLINAVKDSIINQMYRGIDNHTHRNQIELRYDEQIEWFFLESNINVICQFNIDINVII